MDKYDIQAIVGLTPAAIEVTEDEINIAFTDGSHCRFYHDQECCESVSIEDVNGDWDDLIGVPLLVADERTSQETKSEYEENLWTFYTFRTIKGSVDVRWHGASNGFYSMSVDFCHTRPEAAQ